ncbi:hypothetical protein D3C86_1163770 [compost metagenome]
MAVLTDRRGFVGPATGIQPGRGVRDEIGIGPAGQGALDPGEDHGQRVVLGDPAHGFRERLGCGVLADLPGVGLPERQEASRHIGLRGPSTRGESLTRCGGRLLGGLGGRRKGERRSVLFRRFRRIQTLFRRLRALVIAAVPLLAGSARRGLRCCRRLHVRDSAHQIVAGHASGYQVFQRCRDDAHAATSMRRARTTERSGSGSE